MYLVTAAFLATGPACQWCHEVCRPFSRAFQQPSRISEDMGQFRAFAELLPLFYSEAPQIEAQMALLPVPWLEDAQD